MINEAVTTYTIFALLLEFDDVFLTIVPVVFHQARIEAEVVSVKVTELRHGSIFLSF